MLRIRIPAGERYDEEVNRVYSCPGCELQLEHSLLALSKWEATHHKPFIGNTGLTTAEILDYIRCMTINSNIKPDWYWFLDNDDVEAITEYIKDKQTAKVFPEDEMEKQKRLGPKIVYTYSEDIYCKMIELGIPIEFQKWHINKLMALMKTFELRHEDPKKMSAKEIAERNRKINEYNRKRFNSKG